VAVSVSSNREDGVATVMLAGELDLASVDVVSQAIDHEIAAAGTEAVIVDLSDMAFLDSSGIAVLIKGRREADKTGVAYRVIGANGMVRDILRLTGVLEYLSAESTVESPE
jgi:anti-sigma B factor antagonist